MWEKIKSWFKRKPKAKVGDVYKELRGYSKNQLVRELIEQASINNKNSHGVTSNYRKKINRSSKKTLIKAIILLRLQNSKEVKKLRKQVRRKLNGRKKTNSSRQNK